MMILDADTLTVIWNTILDELWRIMTEYNRMDNLEVFLDNLGFGKLLDEYTEEYEEEKKIALIGDASISPEQILEIFDEFGYSEDEVELYLGYKDLKTLDYNKFFNPRYQQVLFGPLPHNTKGKGKYSSFIENYINEDSKHRGIKLQNGMCLKISENSLRQALYAAC